MLTKKVKPELIQKVEKNGFMQNFPGSPDNMRGYDVTSEFLNSDIE